MAYKMKKYLRQQCRTLQSVNVKLLFLSLSLLYIPAILLFFSQIHKTRIKFTYINVSSYICSYSYATSASKYL